MKLVQKKPFMEKVEEAMYQYYGFKALRPVQKQALQAIETGSDVLIVESTGGGKSLIFQLAAIVKHGTAVVISPLIALQKDQVDDCVRRGIKAAMINTHVDDDDQNDILKGMVRGKYKLLYVAPERIRQKRFIRALEQTAVNLIVVDECHSVSRWGHSFRPAYLSIKSLTDALTEEGVHPQIIALTATATGDIEKDIATSIGFSDNYVRIIGDPVRHNISYGVAAGQSAFPIMKDFLKTRRSFFVKEGTHITYCGTRSASEMVANMVRETTGLSTAFYHAGMNADDRTHVQNAFKGGSVRMIVATCAFGMGIDKKDIRSVTHFGIPGSLEDYLQESGRAGRDGLPAAALLIVDDYSLQLRRRFINDQNPPYECFRVVWDWLKSTISPKDVLKVSCNGIAKSISDDLLFPISGTAVECVLNTMETYGVVKREPMPPNSVEIRINYRRAGEAIVNVIDDVSRKVAKAVLKLTGRDGIFSVSLIDLHNESGLSDKLVRKALKSLQDDAVIGVEPLYRGKTTQILDDSVRIDEVLPVSDILAKRSREVGRLNALIEYSNISDRDTRRNYIREYFLKGPKPAELDND